MSFGYTLPTDRFVDSVNPEAVIELAQSIQQIPSPTFAEQERARFIAKKFSEVGLTEVRCETDGDGVTNVYGVLPGADRTRRGLLVSAHTDTVFPEETSLITRTDYEAHRLYGPGIGDNSVAIAALVHIAASAAASESTFPRDVVFLANAREEGLGNLDGIRVAIDHLADSVDCAIVLEGLCLGSVYNRGIAVRRLHVRATTEGGHSWGDYGRPSAIHSLAKIVSAITTIEVPSVPKTTYNVGVIRGGRSVNTIADEAEMWLDLRSAEPGALEELEDRVRSEIAVVSGNGYGDSVSVTTRVVGDRPAGSIPDDDPLVLSAIRARERVGRDAKISAGSTDVNALLAAGIPSVCVGITTGDNAHRTDEYIDIKPVVDGLRQVAYLVQEAIGGNHEA